MKHPDHIPGWDRTLGELAVAIENMRYDKVADFLDYLQGALMKRAAKDREACRHGLATRLNRVATNIYQACDEMDEVWKLCKPHMEKDE